MLSPARFACLLAAALLCCCSAASVVFAQAPLKADRGKSYPAMVLHAEHLLDVEKGVLLSPGEVLVEGERIVAAGTSVPHPEGAVMIDLGQSTLMPGLIDAHVHLFLHPGSENVQALESEQTLTESVPQRTILATQAAREDLLAGFTAERDMGTEGAGSADTAVRNAIDAGLIMGPRLRVSGNAISITGGHEDALNFNPEEHISSNATYADTTDALVQVMREQRKQGADFTKIYETGEDAEVEGKLVAPYQYTEAQLAAAVAEATRVRSRVAVHCTTEPGAAFAVEAGVVSVDHAYQLSAKTMQAMKEKQIYAVPTFAITEYFAQHAVTPEAGKDERMLLTLHASEFKKQLAAGVPMAVGSDVGPFPHGTQAREMELMVEYGMPSADVLRADLLHGARLLGWENSIGQLKPGFYADVIAVDGDPLREIAALRRVRFVMKGGVIARRDAAGGQKTR